MSMQTPDFSIIIPAYNSLELLRRTLESIKAQSGVTIQTVIVDDSNRNDDIEHYVLSLGDASISYHHNRPSLGAIANWNSGLHKADGKYLVLMHHDEAFQGDDYLLKMKDRLQQSDVAIGNILVEKRDGKRYSIYPPRFKMLVLKMPASLFCLNAIGPCAVCAFKREHVEDFDERIKWFVDVEWYYRMMRKRKVTFVPSAVVVSHHGHDEQITKNINVNVAARQDSAILSAKYRSDILVRIAIWLQIYVLHNDRLHAILKKLLGR